MKNAAITAVLSTYFFVACSNSECVNVDEKELRFSSDSDDVRLEIFENNLEQKRDSVQGDYFDKKNNILQSTEYIPLDDTEYPYAGLPRMVIKTKDGRTIRDVKTEISAKAQIWGEYEPESNIMDLSIRGRGNTSWYSPKKSYKIEFENKQEILGMPLNRDWALVANYADKTLMKNYLAYNLSARIGAYYTPRCRFVELFINGEYLGIYLLTETIKISKNRVNIPQNSNSYIVELDAKLRDGEQAVYSYKIAPSGKIFHIHEPQNATKEELSIIEKYIYAFETFLISINENEDNNIDKWINVEDYIKYYWLQEFSRNADAAFLTSVYFSWLRGEKIRMGPVWDFDLAFGGHIDSLRSASYGWYIRNYYWNKYLFKDSVILSAEQKFWLDNRFVFNDILVSVDSVASYLNLSAKNNFRRWNILRSTEYDYHPKAYASYSDAVADLKRWIRERIEWIDKQIGMAN